MADNIHFDIKGRKFREALIKIERRAERNEFDEKLSRLYVNNRVLDDLQTSQNQLVFGRRGVGKTHTLRVFLQPLRTDGSLSHYYDCTSFGSGIGNESSPLNIAIRFFAQLLHRIQGDLLEDVILLENASNQAINDAEAALAKFAKSCELFEDAEVTFDYTNINHNLSSFLSEIGVRRLYIVLDEWAQIPLEAQPYFAEFLKRSFFTNRQVTLKIGVVNYAYRLSIANHNSQIGLEKSADVFSDIRMDNYFVWDEDREFVENFLAGVLYNHLASELGFDLDIDPRQKRLIIERDMLTQKPVLSRLARACEGNARDFLVVFAKSHDEFRRQTKHEKIGQSDVDQAAIAWYRQDKLANIASEKGIEKFLNYLVTSIIRDRKSRTFMIPRDAINHPILMRLFSARILHPLHKEWSHPDSPGERFELITIEYGAYASYKGTKNEVNEGWLFPNDQLPTDTENAPLDDLVPFDDRRSIRKIVVTKNDLDKFLLDV